MAIAFFNIRSKETVIAVTEEHIAAMWGSGDRGPNVTQGQDFGWRLAPAVVVEIDQIKTNSSQILDIARRYNILPEDVTEPIILQYISAKTSAANAPVADNADYTDEYQDEIRRLKRKAAKQDFESTTTTTEESTTTTTTTAVE